MPTVGIRPEHLVFCDAAKARLSGEVLYAEVLGAESLVHLALAEGRMLTVRQSGRSATPTTGEPCFVRFDDADVCAFDGDGRRILPA